jgi:hypothetical protein
MESHYWAMPIYELVAIYGAASLCSIALYLGLRHLIR